MPQHLLILKIYVIFNHFIKLYSHHGILILEMFHDPKEKSYILLHLVVPHS